jgi:hypothetical protein
MIILSQWFFFLGGALSSDPEQAFLGILNKNLLKKVEHQGHLQKNAVKEGTNDFNRTNISLNRRKGKACRFYF